MSDLVFVDTNVLVYLQNGQDLDGLAVRNPFSGSSS